MNKLAQYHVVEFALICVAISWFASTTAFPSVGQSESLVEDYSSKLLKIREHIRSEEVRPAKTLATSLFHQLEAEAPSVDFAQLMSELAWELADLGADSLAEAAQHTAINRLSKLLPPGDPRLLTERYYLGLLLQVSGKHEDAVEELSATLARHLNRNEVDSAEVFWIRAALGNSLLQVGRAADSRSELLGALSLMPTVVGLDYESRADLLTNIGLAFQQEGRLDSADVYLKRGLVIRRENSSQHMAASLNYLGLLHLKMGKLMTAEQELREAEASRRRLLDDIDESIIITQSDLAKVLEAKGDFAGARVLYDSVLSYWTGLLPENDTGLVEPLSDAARVASALGHYGIAGTYLRRTIDLLEHRIPASSPKLEQSQLNLADVLLKGRQFAEAEQVYLALLCAVADADKYADGRSDVINANLAVLYAQRKQFQKAEKQLQELIRQRKTRLGPEHMDVLSAELNLANLLIQSGKHQRAEDPLQRIRRVLGERQAKGPVLCKALNSLAVLKVELGSFDEAEQYYLEALSTWQQKGREATLEIADLNENLGHLEVQRNNLLGADSLFLNATALRSEVLGPNHPILASGMIARAEVRFRIGELGTAASIASEATSLVQQHLGRNLLVLSEADAINMADAARRYADLLLSCVQRDAKLLAEHSNLVKTVLSTKGIVTRVIAERYRRLREHNSPEVNHLADSLRQTRTTISNRFDVFGWRQSNDSAGELTPLVELANSLEARLAQLQSDYDASGAKDSAGGNWELLIPRNSLRLDYILFRDHSALGGDESTSYGVFVSGDSVGTSFIRLGTADVLDSLIFTLHEHMHNLSGRGHLPVATDLQTYHELATRLYELTLGPVVRHSSPDQTWVIAPDGLLWILPFAGLVDGTGAYVIESHIVHYSTPTYVGLDSYREGREASGLLALGDPTYASLTFRDTKPDKGTTPVEDSAKLFAQLPSTRAEIKSIAQLWRETSAEGVSVLLGHEASEYKFKELAKRHRVLHIASHGYSPPPDELEVTTPRWQYVTNHDYIDALVNSGIALAGANVGNSQAPAESNENGFLSSYEVLSLDLSGVDVVVLSGCETALGHVAHNEGILGLQRSFLLAGAHTVLASLWPVDDEMTASLFEACYSDTASRLPVSLGQSQLTSLQRLRQEGLCDHPYNWAGWVTIGMWDVSLANHDRSAEPTH